MAGEKLIFRELLEQNHISFEDFYESCLSVDGQDIWMLFSENLATKSCLERMVAHLNLLTGKQYQAGEVFTTHLYGG